MKTLKILLLAILFIFITASTCFSKTLVFPHLLVNDSWNFGIALNCTSEYDDIVTLELYADNELLNRFQMTIPSYGETLIWGSDFCNNYNCENMSFTLVVRSCSDWTFGTLVRFYNGLPIGESKPQVIPFTPNFQTNYWVPIPSSKYYIYAGQDCCNTMEIHHWLYFREVLREMYLRYKNVPGIDPRPCLGDASILRGQCPGHPGGSHSTGYSVDVNYFTTKESNFTQYRPYNSERVIIWEDGHLVNFDIERNKLFLKLLKEAFPKLQVMMDERIKAVVAPNDIWVDGDPPSKWNHNTHMHLILLPKRL